MDSPPRTTDRSQRTGPPGSKACMSNFAGCKSSKDRWHLIEGVWKGRNQQVARIRAESRKDEAPSEEVEESIPGRSLQLYKTGGWKSNVSDTATRVTSGREEPQLVKADDSKLLRSLAVRLCRSSALAMKVRLCHVVCVIPCATPRVFPQHEIQRQYKHTHLCRLWPWIK